MDSQDYIILAVIVLVLFIGSFIIVSYSSPEVSTPTPITTVESTSTLITWNTSSISSHTVQIDVLQVTSTTPMIYSLISFATTSNSGVYDLPATTTDGMYIQIACYGVPKTACTALPVTGPY